MAKLFVGKIPFKFRDSDLSDLFAPFGQVLSAVVVMDRETGRSKGFGFVELDDASADEAIKQMNNKEIDGRPIVVSVARPREERPTGSFDRNRR